MANPISTRTSHTNNQTSISDHPPTAVTSETAKAATYALCTIGGIGVGVKVTMYFGLNATIAVGMPIASVVFALVAAGGYLSPSLQGCH